MKKILIIDNYDSFTYNLVHYFEDLKCEVTVFRNNQFNIEQVTPFHKIVLSPGPGIPDNAGLTKKIIEVYGKTKSIFGVCLGLQAIAEVFGAKLKNLDKVLHGKSTKINIIVDDESIYNGLNKNIVVGRYHSWVVNLDNLPESLEVTSIDNNGQIMSIRHKTFDIRGVQFHPESILTPFGKQILENWVYN